MVAAAAESSWDHFVHSLPPPTSHTHTKAHMDRSDAHGHADAPQHAGVHDPRNRRALSPTGDDGPHDDHEHAHARAHDTIAAPVKCHDAKATPHPRTVQPCTAHTAPVRPPSACSIAPDAVHSVRVRAGG